MGLCPPLEHVVKNLLKYLIECLVSIITVGEVMTHTHTKLSDGQKKIRCYDTRISVTKAKGNTKQ